LSLWIDFIQLITPLDYPSHLLIAQINNPTPTPSDNASAIQPIGPATMCAAIKITNTQNDIHGNNPIKSRAIQRAIILNFSVPTLLRIFGLLRFINYYAQDFLDGNMLPMVSFSQLKNFVL
jgi:hypothetical protein